MRKMYPARSSLTQISHTELKNRGEKDGFVLFSIEGYIFEIKADRITNIHEKRMIGNDITTGALQFFKGGFPDWTLGQDPPFPDENKLSEDAYEYLQQWKDHCLHHWGQSDPSSIVGAIAEWDQKE